MARDTVELPGATIAYEPGWLGAGEAPALFAALALERRRTRALAPRRHACAIRILLCGAQERLGGVQVALV